MGVYSDHMTPNDPRLDSQILICLGANKQAPQPPRKPFLGAGTVMQCLAVGKRKPPIAVVKNTSRRDFAHFSTFISARKRRRDFCLDFFFRLYTFRGQRGKSIPFRSRCSNFAFGARACETREFYVCFLRVGAERRRARVNFPSLCVGNACIIEFHFDHLKFM